MQPGTNDDPAPLPARADVVVVGGGLAGLAVAVGLRERGVDVVVLDPGADDGASARAPGAIVTGLTEHPVSLGRALGPDGHAAVLALGRRSSAWLAARVPVTPCDQVWVAVDDRDRALAEQSAGVLADAGLPVTVLDAAGLAARGLRGLGGYAVAGDGLVDPLAALAALRARVTVARSQVRDVAADAGGLAVDTDRGPVRAEVVVWASGYRTPEDWFADKLWPVREQAARFAVDAPLTPVVGRSGHGWSSVRPGPRGTVIVAGCRWATPHLEVGELDPVVVPAVQDQLDRFAGRVVPGLGAPEARWAWIETHTCDGLPIVGPLPGDPRRIACTGFVGVDWGLAPAAAEAVVDGLLGGEGRTPPTFAATRF
ncbi:MAG: FAD-binding oxidoreductase [Myxococcota bacterium]